MRQLSKKTDDWGEEREKEGEGERGEEGKRGKKERRRKEGGERAETFKSDKFAVCGSHSQLSPGIWPRCTYFMLPLRLEFLRNMARERETGRRVWARGYYYKYKQLPAAVAVGDVDLTWQGFTATLRDGACSMQCATWNYAFSGSTASSSFFQFFFYCFFFICFLLSWHRCWLNKSMSL